MYSEESSLAFGGKEKRIRGKVHSHPKIFPILTRIKRKVRRQQSQKPLKKPLKSENWALFGG